jgi:hypothetical protein
MINRGTSVGAAASDISIGASVAVASIISSAMVVFTSAALLFVLVCFVSCLAFDVQCGRVCGDK